MKRVFGTAIALGLLAAVLPACSKKKPDGVPTTPNVAPQAGMPQQPDGGGQHGPFAVGQAAPDIVGEDIDGKKFKLSDYRGKVVMLDFWGHW